MVGEGVQEVGVEGYNTLGQFAIGLTYRVHYNLILQELDLPILFYPRRVKVFRIQVLRFKLIKMRALLYELLDESNKVEAYFQSPNHRARTLLIIAAYDLL